MATERDSLFGELAARNGLVDPAQLAVTVAETIDQTDSESLADRLVRRGLIDQKARSVLDQMVDLTIANTYAPSALPPTVGATVEWTHGQGSSITAGRVSSGSQPTQVGTAATVDLTDSAAAALTQAANSGHVRISALGAMNQGASSHERYSRTRLHARGGIGQVWLAKDVDLGREVALKELRPERHVSANAAARFLEEARITGQLEHPGIVPIYELAKSPDGSKSFYTMRFVKGKTLTEAISEYHAARKAGKATEMDRVALLNAFVGVCNAVGYAHSRRVIHRDLKGQNVVLGDFGEVMVLDWGLAKVIDQPDINALEDDDVAIDPMFEEGRNATRQGQILGTPAYMAPEQAEGRLDLLDGRTDVYGLGAILYEILTGEPPFTGSSTQDLLRRVREEAPPLPRIGDNQVPRPLEAICMKAMSKGQDDRYETALELAAEINRFIADEPVTAYTEPFTIRMARWMKRHRQAVQSGAAALFIVAVALGATTLLVRKERDEARQQRRIARQAVDDMYTRVAQTWLENNDDQLQREFLTKARDYYVEFANIQGSDPADALQQGQAFARLADVDRKLGDPRKAITSFDRSIEILTKLAESDELALQSLVRAETGLGDAYLAMGDQSTALSHFESAARLTKGHESNPALVAVRGMTERRLGDLHRVLSKSAESEASYEAAIATLGTLSKSASSVETKRDLALAYDGLGLVLHQSNKPDKEEKAHRQAIEILENLVKIAPTAPQYREALARSMNSLGLLMKDTGSSDESKALLNRQIALGERLAEDFPTRPDYRRALARACMNLGVVLRQNNKNADAEAAFRRALDIDETLSTDFKDLVDYRRDRARCLSNLAIITAANGKHSEAEKLYSQAIDEYRQLIKDSPEVPDHRSTLANTLVHLGELLSATNRRDEGMELSSQAVEIYSELVSEYPENLEFLRGNARVLGVVGTILANRNEPEQSAKYLAKSMAAYESLVHLKGSKAGDRALYAQGLNNYGDVLTKTKSPVAEEVLQKSIAIQDRLVQEFPKDAAYRRSLALSKLTLGEWLVPENRLADADKVVRESSDILVKLAEENPKVGSYQRELAYALGELSSITTGNKKLDEARDLLERAVRADRAAIEATPALAKSVTAQLTNHLLSLSEARIAVGGHLSAFQAAEEYVRLAGDRPKTKAREKAAKILASCIEAAEVDSLLPETRRSLLIATYADRAISLLRESIELGETDASKIGDEKRFAKLKDRETFKALSIVKSDQAGAGQ